MFPGLETRTISISNVTVTALSLGRKVWFCKLALVRQYISLWVHCVNNFSNNGFANLHKQAVTEMKCTQG